jgi:Zn-dependent peptidase ImmA (M78 family)
MNRYENEANYFAADLLISDDDLTEYESFSVPELAALFGVEDHLIKYRLKRPN